MRALYDDGVALKAFKISIAALHRQTFLLIFLIKRFTERVLLIIYSRESGVCRFVDCGILPFSAL
jgi:hypothetical protein